MHMFFFGEGKGTTGRCFTAIICCRCKDVPFVAVFSSCFLTYSEQITVTFQTKQRIAQAVLFGPKPQKEDDSTARVTGKASKLLYVPSYFWQGNNKNIALQLERSVKIEVVCLIVFLFFSVRSDHCFYRKFPAIWTTADKTCKKKS